MWTVQYPIGEHVAVIKVTDPVRVHLTMRLFGLEDAFLDDLKELVERRQANCKGSMLAEYHTDPQLDGIGAYVVVEVRTAGMKSADGWATFIVYDEGWREQAEKFADGLFEIFSKTSAEKGDVVVKRGF